MKKLLLLLFGIVFFVNCNDNTKTNQAKVNLLEKEIFLKDLKQRTFNFFWDLVDSVTWQIPDRYPNEYFASIAATGFGLSTYIIGVENKYISRQQATVRVLNTLIWLSNSIQGPQITGVTGYKGFYYHFLTNKEGYRFKNVELSTIDTAWLMAGILSCQTYFDRDNDQEKQIRDLSDSLYLRVEWDWAMNGKEFMSMGWHPETGFIESKWVGYTEAMMLMILAMGSPTHPINPSVWKSCNKGYEWADFYGYEHVNFESLFGHQYTQMYIDFRGIKDSYMQGKGIDYFENSRRATLSNRAYCIKNPVEFVDYSDSIWGLTACDGPADTIMIINGKKVQFFTYRSRGASVQYIVDDGTIAPTAAGGSIPFAPDECISTLMAIRNKYGENIYSTYGFKDAFNPTFITKKYPNGWFDIDYLGIDQGPIIIQLENYQSELIWNVMKKNKYIISGLRKAGFSGGWLDKVI